MITFFCVLFKFSVVCKLKIILCANKFFLKNLESKFLDKISPKILLIFEENGGFYIKNVTKHDFYALRNPTNMKIYVYNYYIFPTTYLLVSEIQKYGLHFYQNTFGNLLIRSFHGKGNICLSCNSLCEVMSTFEHKFFPSFFFCFPLKYSRFENFLLRERGNNMRKQTCASEQC